MKRLTCGWVAVAGCAVALLGPAGTAAMAQDVRFSGQSCQESVATFAVPVELAEEALPAGWTPYTDAAGQAVVGVTVLSCDTLWIGDESADGRMLSDVGIQVVSPENGFPAWYQLWQHSSSDQLRAAMAELGVAGKRAKLANDETDGPPARFTATADAPGANDYALSGSTLGPAPAGNSDPVWWHDGRHGRVKLTYQVIDAWAAAGPGELRAQPGSALAELAGTERDTAGLFLTFSFTATAGLWAQG